MRQLVSEAGLEHAIEIDSAGTGDYHVGEPPDRRARAAARERGVELSGRARQFRAGDFARFDYVVAMDRDNLADLERIAPDAAALRKLHLLRAFDPEAPKHAGVPDPYYGGEGGFEEVLEIVFAACRGLLAEIRRKHAL
jgi:protein-tyrosine phosphatase